MKDEHLSFPSPETLDDPNCFCQTPEDTTPWGLQSTTTDLRSLVRALGSCELSPYTFSPSMKSVEYPVLRTDPWIYEQVNFI